MRVRSCQFFAAWAVLTLLTTATLAAQRPQTHQGFWIGMAGGTGNFTSACDGCASQDHGGGTINVRLGGSPSQQFLLGGEVHELLVDLGSAELGAGYVAFTVSWYPSPTGGLFVKGGPGVGTYYKRLSDSVTERSTSAAIQLGVGYDIRVGRKISIGPMLTWWTSNKAYLKDHGTPVARGFRQGGVTLQFGITFYSLK